MAVYVALLRAVNVGGHGRLKMADLKRTLEGMGLTRVQTYGQSGNVLFEADAAEDSLRQRMEREISNAFGLATDVILRTADEFKQIVRSCPFAAEVTEGPAATSPGAGVHIAFMLRAPAQAGVDQFAKFATGADEYRIQGREVYLLLRDGVRNSRIANNLDRLAVPATMRNWNTVIALAALVKAMHV